MVSTKYKSYLSNVDRKMWNNVEYNLDVYYGSFDDESLCFKLSEFIYSIISEIKFAIVGLITGLKSTKSLFILLLIIIFFYAVLGHIYLIDNDPWHWSQLKYGIMSLIRIATLDDWNKIFYITYHGCLIDSDNYVQDASLLDLNLAGSPMLCMDKYDSNDDFEYIVGDNVAENKPRPFVAVLFFISFIFITSTLILPLIIVGVVRGFLDSISYPTAEEIHRKNEKIARKLIKQEPKDRKTRRALNYLSLAMYGHRPELLDERNVTILTFYYIYREEGWEIVKQAIRQMNFHGWYLLICDSCDEIAEYSIFQYFIDLCILYLAVITGIMTSSKYNREYGSTFDIVQYVVITIFLIEAIIKILAEKEGHFFYFHSIWNCLDFTVVTLSFIPFLSPSMVALLRLLRLHQILRKIPVMRNMMTAAAYGIKNIIYIGILLTFYLLIMSIVGSNLFGANDPLRFGTIGGGMITLLCLTTFDGLADAFYTNAFGCAVHSNDIDCEESIAQYWFAFWYFTLNIIIGSLLIIGLFMGVRKVFVLEPTIKYRSYDDIYNDMDEILAKHTELTSASIDKYRRIFELINISKSWHLYKIELLIAIEFSGVNKERHLRMWRAQNSDSDEYYQEQTMNFSRFISYLMLLRSEHLLRKQKKKGLKYPHNAPINARVDNNISQLEKNNNDNTSELLLYRQRIVIADEERRQVLLHQVDSEWKDFVHATITGIDYGNPLTSDGVDTFDYMAETPTNLLRKAVKDNCPYRFDEFASNSSKINNGSRKKKKSPRKSPRKSPKKHQQNDKSLDQGIEKLPQFVPRDPDTGLEMSPMSPMSPIKIDNESFAQNTSPITGGLQPRLSLAAILGEDHDDNGSVDDGISGSSSSSDYEPSLNTGSSFTGDVSDSNSDTSEYDTDDDSSDESNSLSDSASDSYSSSEMNDAQSYAASWVETRSMRRQRKQIVTDSQLIQSLKHNQKHEHVPQTYSIAYVEQKIDDSPASPPPQQLRQRFQPEWYSNANDSILTMSNKKSNTTAHTTSSTSIVPTTLNIDTQTKNTNMVEMRIKSVPRPPTGSDYEAAIILLNPRMCKESIWDYILKQLELCEINVCGYGFATSTQLERTGVFDSHYKRVAQAALFEDPATLLLTSQKKSQFERTFSISWDVAIATNKVVNAIEAEKQLAITSRALGSAWRESMRSGRGFQIAPDKWIAAVKRSNRRKKEDDHETIYVINGHFCSMRESFLSAGARVLVIEITWRTSISLTDRLRMSSSNISNVKTAIREGEDTPYQARLTWKGLLIHVIGIGGIIYDNHTLDKEEKNVDRLNHSICGVIHQEWQSFGLDAPPTIVENVVTSSHGAFEAMVHRSLWKQFTITSVSIVSDYSFNPSASQPFRLVTDPLCVRLLSAGIAARTIKHWMNNPIIHIPNEGKKPLFSILEGLDSTATVRVCVKLYQQSLVKMKATSSKIHP